MTLLPYLLDTDTHSDTLTDTCIFLMRGEHATLAAHARSRPLQQQVMSEVAFADLTYGVQTSAAAKRKQNQTVLDRLALNLAVFD